MGQFGNGLMLVSQCENG